MRADRVAGVASVAAGLALLGLRHRLELVVLPLLVAGGTYWVSRYSFVVLLPTWS